MDGLRRSIDRVLSRQSPLDHWATARLVREAARAEAPLRQHTVESTAAASLIGWGPLEGLLDDPTVSDILVNGPDEVWIERDGRLEHTDVCFPGNSAILAAVERALLPLGLRLDRLSPAVDARLPDGSRLHAVVPPASVDGPVVAIRRFMPTVADMDELIRRGSVDRGGAALLQQLVESRSNLLVSGPTGAGKTTLLNILSHHIASDQRIVTIEEAAELDLTGHVVRLEARPPNAEGMGQVSVRDLVRQALRMRPDRIVVGEVRGVEALDLIQAMATGHAGSMGTVHASGPDEAMWRVEVLASSAREAPADSLRQMLWSAIHAVVHVDRVRSDRRVATISLVEEGRLEVAWRA